MVIFFFSSSLWFGCLESQSMLIFLGSCLLELGLPSSSWSAGLLLQAAGFCGIHVIPHTPHILPLSHCSLLTHIATHVKRCMQWMGVGSSCLLWFWLHLLDDCKMLCLVKWLFFFLVVKLEGVCMDQYFVRPPYEIKITICWFLPVLCKINYKFNFINRLIRLAASL